MANPYSDLGWSDNDYATAVGTLVGEAVVKDGLKGFAAVADVIANRMNDIKSVDRFGSKYGSSFAEQALAKNQKGQYEFSTWSPSVGAAYTNAKAAKAISKEESFLAALNPERAVQVSPALAQPIAMAKQGLDAVFRDGTLRGISQGATYYDNATVTAKNKTGGFHDGLESKYGSVNIGAHRFTGPSFNEQPFDNVTYNGQLGVPPTADVNFSGVPFNENRLDDNSLQIDPVPSGSVDFMGSLPNLTPVENVHPVSFNEALGPPIDGFNWPGDQFNDFSTDPLQAGFSLPDAAFPNFDDVALDTYPDITAGTAFDPLTDFNPVDAAPVNFDDVSVGSYPEITAGLFDAPASMADVAPGSIIPGSASIMDATGFVGGWDPEATASVAPSQPMGGFSQGFDSNIPTPDFSAPSLDQKIADRTAQDRIDAFADHQMPGISYGNQDQINANVMAELAPHSGFHAGFDGWSPASVPETVAAQAPAPTGFENWSTSDLEAASFDNERALGRLNETALTGWGATPSGLRDQDAPLSVGLGGQVGFGDFAGFTAPPTQAISSAAPIAQGDIGAPSYAAPRSAPTSPSFAQSAPTPPERPDFATSLPAAPAPSSSGFGLGSLFGDSTVRDGNFINAMANPDVARAYSPGMLDGWVGGALKGAALGALTGGPFGALAGGAWGGLNPGGRLAAAFSNQFGGIFDGPTWDNFDPATYGYGEGFNARGERSHTGVDNSGNASVGDGSYGETSGRNDNNPQGIL